MVSPALKARDRKGPSSDGDGDGAPLVVAHTLRGKGHDASEDGSGRGVPLAVDYTNGIVGEDLCGTLEAAQRKSNRGHGVMAYRTSPNNGAWETGDRIDALTTGTDRTSHVVTFQSTTRTGDDVGDLPSLVAATPSAIATFDAVQITSKANRSRVEPSRPSSTLSNRSRMGVVSSGIRRLTPRECERLQGFPEIQRRVTIVVCGESQKTAALAALQNLRSREFVWTADGSGSMRFAPPAELPSDMLLRDRDRLAAMHVRCDCERMEVEIRSPERSPLSAVSAGSSESFPLPMGIDSFARLVALTTSTLARAIGVGRVESQASGAASTLPWSGSGIVLVSGREIAERAEGAAPAVATARRLSMSTTSDDSSIGPTCDSTLITLCCSVASAIASFIPDSTSSGSFFAFDLTTAQGWTAVEHRGKLATDGPRYEAIGNSMAVPVLAWIGRRLQLVDSLAASEAA